MSLTSLQAPGAFRQSSDSTNILTGHGRANALAALPKQWQKALLAIGWHKQPIDPVSGRNLSAWITSEPPTTEQLLAAPAVGLRTGSVSSTLCLDFDGPKAWETFRSLFEASAKELLPATISWSSGKLCRCQMAFHVGEAEAAILNGKVSRVGTLEFRWQKQQSVVTGHHPETGSYRWIKAPWEVDLAPFPKKLLRLIPDRASGSVRKPPERAPGAPTTAFKVPLDQFITWRSKWLVQNGSKEGNCNDDAIALSMDLVGTEKWLKEKGVGVIETAQELFDTYCSNCPDTINGEAFDWPAMHRRFVGAVNRDPSPPTPEDKLQERLAFHKRMAVKGGGF